jgi:hypothetical protein
LTSPRTSAGAISQSFECFCGPLALAIRVSRPLLLQRRSKTGPRAVGSPNRSHKRFGKGCLADAPRPMDTAPSRARGPKHKAVSRGKIGNGPTAGGRRACEARTRTAPVVRLESHQCSGGSSTGAPQVSESRPSETSQSRRPYALMPFRPTTLERAYQLAESGACKKPSGHPRLFARRRLCGHSGQTLRPDHDASASAEVPRQFRRCGHLFEICGRRVAARGVHHPLSRAGRASSEVGARVGTLPRRTPAAPERRRAHSQQPQAKRASRAGSVTRIRPLNSLMAPSRSSALTAACALVL